jgi:organic hydroperoxide reductase OsmC/OhrA
MLFFLSVAAKRKYVVYSYVDDAVGIMEKDGDGKISMTKVILKPHAQFSGNKKTTMEQLEKMHHQSHE